MAMNTSVFEMVHQVIGDAKTKLASAAPKGIEKRAAAKVQPSQSASGEDQLSEDYLSKLASACDHLSSHLHLIEDSRSPQEKLAEYAEINRLLMKRAFEGGDKDHQSTEAEASSISPTTVSTDNSGTGVGAGNAIPSAPAMTPGESMDAGESGEATSANIPDKNVTPNEKPNPLDAANAFETNMGMMMPAQPEDLLQQSGGTEKSASRALRTLDKVTGKADHDLRQKFAAAKRVRVLMNKAAQAGIPADAVGKLLRKFAGDEENRATISAGSDPALQSEPGVPSVLSQGSEVGSNTPRGSAPTSGEGGGRDLLSSNEAAMNATKAQAKQQNKGALSELLTEPMQSSEHDHTLQMSLDNTSSAGVKISAARELLKRAAASSPGFSRKVAALVKRAEGEPLATPAATPPPAGPPMGAPPMAPPMEPPMGEEGGGDGTMSAALNAVLSGVTPEDLAAAEAILAGEAGGAPEEAAPDAGAEAPEKVQQFGGDSGGGGLSSPSPTMA
jgi:hypothetical protein